MSPGLSSGFGTPTELLLDGGDVFSMLSGTVQPLDLDLDGDLDGVSVLRDALFGVVSLRTILGDGAGGFAQQQKVFITGWAGSSIATGDFDLDGEWDVLRDDATLHRGLAGPSIETLGTQLHDVPALLGAMKTGDVDRDGVLDVAGGLPLTPAYASFGLGMGSFVLPNGCDLLLSPWLAFFVGFTLDATGAGSLPIAISPAAATGVVATAQVGLFDPGAPGYFTLTNGLAITIE